MTEKGARNFVDTSNGESISIDVFYRSASASDDENIAQFWGKLDSVW